MKISTKKKIAIFDFDGTITKEDSFVAYLKFIFPKSKQYRIMLKFAPYILAYKYKLISAADIRSKLINTLKGKHLDELHRLGLEHCNENLHKMIRPIIYEKIKWHQSRNHDVVIISASLDLYLKPWCEKMQISHLICNTLKYKNDLATGYLSNDDIGPRKLELLKEQFQLAKYEKIYAYGDSEEDKPFLAIANESMYIPSKN